jgi:hypothetical protein
MNKKEERAERAVIIRRNASAYKASAIKASVLKAESLESLNTRIMLCKTQASLIDLALSNHLTVSETALKLVETSLCTSLESAYARIKRHKNNDLDSRIVKRALVISALETFKASATE